jgi:hypothetical protein
MTKKKDENICVKKAANTHGGLVSVIRLKPSVITLIAHLSVNAHG